MSLHDVRLRNLTLTPHHNQSMVRTYGVRVIRRLAHPGRGFTQGLLSEGETIWESVGKYGQSELRRYALADGTSDGTSDGRSGTARKRGETPDARAKLAPEFFAEGICRVGDSIWQLTWKELVAFRWDAASLTLRDKVRFNREGWGMCAVVAVGPSGELTTPEVVTSNGTDELVRRDPDTLDPREIVQVRCQGARVQWLNDLTWAGGLVWANIAGTDCLAGIDLASREVTDIVDAGGAAERHGRDPQAIMNGIAAATTPGEFLLTGKTWRSIRQVSLVPDRGRGHVKRLLRGWHT
jgi:glutaminyl-peptide cyclotransferase